MRTVRRLYFYLVAFISLEVVIWGVISLARTVFDNLPGGGASSMLAVGLSLLLVGLPIFLLHWLIAQREALRDEEERTTRIRAIFHYGVRLATWIPIVQNVLALISRPIFTLVGEMPSQALIGAGQNTVDNLVAIAANLIAWAYIENVLRADWKAGIADKNLRDVRRLFRYIWVNYTLGLAVTGVVFLLMYVFYLPGALNTAPQAWLANGIALALVCTPLWVWMWMVVQKSLDEAGERLSVLRLVVLYLLALGGVVVTLSAVGSLFADLLRWAMGETQSFTAFLSGHNTALALAVPFGVIWYYFNLQLRSSVAAQEDALQRAALIRFYYYILALIGNVTTFLGAFWLLDTLTNMWLGDLSSLVILRKPLAQAIAALAVGLPLWLLTWLPMQAEANPGSAQGNTELGEHARRSVIRKAYLYLLLFLTVVGVMIAAGSLFYFLLYNVLGTRSTHFAYDFALRLQSLVLVSVWLGYHFWALRQDGRFVQRALGNRHAIYPVLIIQMTDHPFAHLLVQTLQRKAPRLPVALRHLENDSLDESLANTRVVVLPVALAMNPPESLRLWLSSFTGQRLLVPLPVEGWNWVGVPSRSAVDMVKETTAALLNLAEGQPVRPTPTTSPWAVAGYVLGGLFVFQILMVVIALLFSVVMSMTQ